MRRFISEDPIKTAGGINYFTFVANNPLNLIDPFGLKEIPVCTTDPAWDSDKYFSDPSYDRNIKPSPPVPSNEDRDFTPESLELIGAGSGLIITGVAVTGAGVNILAVPTPQTLIGGAIVTTVGIGITTIGIGTSYLGWNLR